MKLIVKYDKSIFKKFYKNIKTTFMKSFDIILVEGSSTLYYNFIILMGKSH